MFQNPEITIPTIPELDNDRWLPMHDRFLTRQMVERAITLTVIAIGAFGLNLLPGVVLAPNGLIAIALAALALPILLWPIVSVPRMGYLVRDKDLLFRSGVVFRSITAVPFNRIQHVESSNTPLDRRFGVATLQLFTAGGSGGDLKISGLEAGRAEQLRLFILDKVGASIEAD